MWSTSVPDPDSAVWWFRVAIGDLGAARALMNNETLPPRVAAAFSQQAAEKAMKAAIAFAGTDPPRTHNLAVLSAYAQRQGLVITEALDLEALTDGLSAGRYPDADEPSMQSSDTADLIASSQVIVDTVREYLEANGVALLGIEPL